MYFYNNRFRLFRMAVAVECAVQFLFGWIQRLEQSVRRFCGASAGLNSLRCILPSAGCG